MFECDNGFYLKCYLYSDMYIGFKLLERKQKHEQKKKKTLNNSILTFDHQQF